jgi:hypothetical protein
VGIAEITDRIGNSQSPGTPGRGILSARYGDCWARQASDGTF